jgi:long-subunit acyl-CoA synthetase (AMP-forming)
MVRCALAPRPWRSRSGQQCDAGVAKDEEETPGAADGWFLTGDLGVMFRMATYSYDRAKDHHLGGENISGKIEQALATIRS